MLNIELSLSDLEVARLVMHRIAASGVTSLDEAVRRLDEHVKMKHQKYRDASYRQMDRKQSIVSRKNATEMRKSLAQQLQTAPNCPECGSKMVIEPKVVSDSVEFVFNCKYGCKYSEYVGNEQQFKKRMGINNGI